MDYINTLKLGDKIHLTLFHLMLCHEYQILGKKLLLSLELFVMSMQNFRLVSMNKWKKRWVDDFTLMSQCLKSCYVIFNDLLRTASLMNVK